jgi:hypothetical protein
MTGIEAIASQFGSRDDRHLCVFQDRHDPGRNSARRP